MKHSPKSILIPVSLLGALLAIGPAAIANISWLLLAKPTTAANGRLHSFGINGIDRQTQKCNLLLKHPHQKPRENIHISKSGIIPNPRLLLPLNWRKSGS